MCTVYIVSRDRSIQIQSIFVIASYRGVEKKMGGVTVNEYKVCLVGEKNTL